MKYLQIVLLLFLSYSAKSQVKLAKIFGDNMVLQRHVTIPVWGWAKPNETIQVQFHKQQKSTKANNKGKWVVYLNPEIAGGPYELIVNGEQNIKVKNILVGEVWICSGQSNMEMMVGQSDNAENEIKNAPNYANIRHIKIPKEINSLPNNDISQGVWEVTSAQTVSNFTGVGYFFAKKLYDYLNVPIGLINASWGGSIVETWMSRESFENSDEFNELIKSMPIVNLDSLLNIKMIASNKKIEALQNSKFADAQVSLFKEQNFNDANWLNMNEPEVWETQDLGDFDGVVWLRKHINLTKNQIKNDALLEIPAIDDADSTFVNGVFVGSTNGWDKKRAYNIKSAILKEGANVIAIRVEDNSGSGGIYGDAANFKLKVYDSIINLSGNWKYQVASIYDGVNFNDFPSLCYNAMIHPLIPFAFQGVIWYQGESNISRAFEYQKTFPMLIHDWRNKWNTNFPFYYVQLATFNSEGDSNTGSSWAELREAQTKTLQVSNTGMAVTTDVGMPNDIHPTNKKTVGQRLASIALNNVYKEKMTYQGPMFASMKRIKNKMIIKFNNTGKGLVTNTTGKNVYGFEIAGVDQVFYDVKAVIKNNKVVLFTFGIQSPMHVRYSWRGDASKSNLFNNDGFPAVPFRTDDWNTITKEVKYKF